MPHEVSVREPETLVQVIWRDLVTADDLMEYEREYFGSSRLASYHHLVDFRDCELDVGFNEMIMLASHATPTGQAPYLGARTAVLVRGEAQFERAEFYQHARHQVCDRGVREVCVFYEADDAYTWVAEATVISL